MNQENGKTIQSVERALSIIQCIDQSANGLTLTELSEMLNLNVGTVRGLAMTLLNNGYLIKSEKNNRFFLGYEFLMKANRVSEGYVRYLRTCAFPYMNRIAAKHQMNIWLQIVLHNRIYTVDVVEPTQTFYTYSPKMGADIPLHASVSGKLYVASLAEAERNLLVSALDLRAIVPNTITDRAVFRQEIEKIVRQGYATVNEETDIGMSAVGVPIITARQHLAGTLSTVAPTPLLRMKQEDVLPELLTACQAIAAHLWQQEVDSLF